MHHRNQLRKGTRIPFVTHVANIALILARYDRDDDTIIAAILHDVIEDCKDHTVDEHCRSIRAGFGETVLTDVLTVTKPETDAAGGKLSSADEKNGYIEQVARGSRRAMWVCAADKLHNARCILSDLKRSPDDQANVWKRFKGTPAEAAAFYPRVHSALLGAGFKEPIMEELEEAAAELVAAASSPPQSVVSVSEARE